MPLAETLAVLLVVAVIVTLMAGYPVALTLAGVSLAFAVLGHLLGVMDFGILGALPDRIYGVITNPILLAIPLFVFMGVMLEQSRIAEDLLERMGRLFGSLRGGLGYSAVVVGALLAASTGIVGATAVTMGLIMLPAMLRHGYDPRLAAGTVAASATLAQIVPPSTVLIVLGDQLNNAYQAAQLAQGNFAPNALSVSDLFAGAVVPGALLVGLYLAYLVGDGILAAGDVSGGRGGRQHVRPTACSKPCWRRSSSSPRCWAPSCTVSRRRPKRLPSARSAPSCSPCARRGSRTS